MSKKMLNRINRLMPNGKPRYIRCYDIGEDQLDRYTIVYTGNWPGRIQTIHGYRYTINLYVGCSASGYFCQHGESEYIIDRPKYSHLGKPIDFDDLPKRVQMIVYDDYCKLWDLPEREFARKYLDVIRYL